MINKVFVNSEGFIEIWVVGDQTAADTREMGEKVTYYIEQLRTVGKPVLILDNLIKMGRTDNDVRKEVGRFGKTLDFDRAAMVGDGSLFMRYGTNLMLRAVGRPNARYFGNLESARKWLLTGAEALGRRS
jgi:hypothetical protein